MARPKLELDEGRAIKALLGRIGSPAPFLKQAGVLLVARTQAAFQKQRRVPGKAWLARSVPNVAGIVADLARGSSVKSRRFDARPALVDTGQLRNSITFRVAGRTTVEVGTRLPYASIHQTGGVSRQRITPRVLEGLAAFLKKRKDLSPVLGFLFRLRDRDLETRVPARPFLNLAPEDRRDLVTLWTRFLAARGVT